MIPVGTYLTVRVTGIVLAFFSSDTLQAAVAADLNGGSDLTIRSFDMAAPGLASQILGGEPLTYQYRATLVVRTGETYAQDGPGREPSSVSARVASAFYVATGVMPTAATETVNGTKEPAPPAAASNWLDAITSLPANLGSALNSDLKLLLVVLLAVVVVLALVFGWGPNVGTLAHVQL